MKNNKKIKINKLLVAGDSFVDGQTWFENIFETNEIKNIGKQGAGNKFIADGVITEIVEGFNPDFVLVVWSGLLRFDLTVSKKTQLKNNSYFGETKYSKYFFNTTAPFRDKNSSMKIKNEIIDWMYNEKDYVNIKTQSLLNILSCQNFLKANKIPYRFTFIYNFLDKNFDHNHLTNEKVDTNGFMSTLGSIDSKHPICNFIDQNMILRPFALDFGLRHGVTRDDLFHLTKEGYDDWSKELLNNLHSESEQ